jgi:hypothetical protein
MAMATEQVDLRLNNGIFPTSVLVGVMGEDNPHFCYRSDYSLCDLFVVARIRNAGSSTTLPELLFYLLENRKLPICTFGKICQFV